MPDLEAIAEALVELDGSHLRVQDSHNPSNDQHLDELVWQTIDAARALVHVLRDGEKVWWCEVRRSVATNCGWYQKPFAEKFMESLTANGARVARKAAALHQACGWRILVNPEEEG